VPVVAVDELVSDAISRELCLIKVDGEELDHVHAATAMYDADVVDSSDGTVTIEMTGSQQKIDAAIETFERFDILELARTGAAALERGDQMTTSW